MSEKTISLRAKMVFNLFFVPCENFYLLYLFFLGINSWSLCKSIDKRKREKKRKERKGKERVLKFFSRRDDFFQGELKSLTSFQAINIHSRGLKLFIL